jgi:branched-chain amino acid transport system permease protein
MNVETKVDETSLPTVATSSRWGGRTGERLGPAKAGALLGGVVVVLLLIPRTASEYWIYLVTLWFAYAVAVLGLRVLFGMCGQLSLGQGAFMGVGAYTSAFVVNELSLTFPYELALVVVVSAVAALVVGVPALRVSGLRLALVTLAFGELFQWWLRDAKDLTGGEQGQYVPPLLMGALDTQNPTVLYGIVAVFAVIATAIVIRLPRTPVGRAMSAVREAETAARSVGVAISRTKLVAFLIAGIFGGVSGMLVAHVSGSISPLSFDLFGSIYLLVAVILGGARSTVGAWIGAAYIVLVPQAFASFGWDRLYLFLSGVLLVIVASFFPDGLASIFGRVRRLVRRPATRSPQEVSA